METLDLKIEGMMCQHCKKSVEKILNEIEGIQSFEVDLEEGKAQILFNQEKLKIENISKAFEGSNYHLS